MGFGSPRKSTDRSRYVHDSEEVVDCVRAVRSALERDRAARLPDRSRRPMRPTFYIASSSENHVDVRRLGDLFQSRGWCWSPGHAWGRKRIHNPMWVAQDMHAALTADVFVLILHGKTSVGPHAQLCARWATHRPIFGIRQEMEHHPLHDLPEIIWYETMEDFAQATFGP